MIDQAQLETLCAIAQLAGAEVMAVYGQEIAAWQKADASPLTKADLRADRVIRAGLERHFPGVFILSEESVSDEPVSEVAAQDETFFLVDPLDGTKEFLKRNGEFTVNIALIQAGQPVVGVVLAPAMGVLYFAAHGVGAWRRDAEGQTPLLVTQRDANVILRIIGSRSHVAPEMQRWLDALAEPYEFVGVGSSLKFCRIAEGAADAYPRFGLTSQWDTAAGQCVLEVAGGRVITLAGDPLCYGLDHPVLNPHFFASGDKAIMAICKP